MDNIISKGTSVYSMHDIQLRRTFTKHECKCGNMFFVRASFYDCPVCGKESQQEINLNKAFSIMEALSRSLALARVRETKEEWFTECKKHLPSFTVEQIKVLYEEIN